MFNGLSLLILVGSIFYLIYAIPAYIKKPGAATPGETNNLEGQNV